MDENGNKNLDVDDFRWGLMDYGISISKDEACEIMAHFDKDKNGSVNFDEFLVTLRGDLNETRTASIRKAYEKLDVTKDGRVTLDDIARLYNVSSHPEVVNGSKSDQDVYMEFMSLWDT
jgi:Ca2+-binding EF-hand superfamily protein